MRIIIGLGHPAHFHLFKNLIKLSNNSFEYKIVVTDKDVLKILLDSENFEYTVLARSNSNEGLIKKFKKLINTSFTLLKISKEYKPDLFIGCLTQLAWVSFLLRKKNIFFAEDDFSYTFLQGLITYPFVNHILTPSPVKVGFFSYKQIKYDGYHKLAYLHPKVFTPNILIKNKYISTDNYFLIRTVNQQAYHDINAKGLNKSTLHKIIPILEKIGKVYITSESKLDKEFDKYKLNIEAKDIHHILYFTKLFISDSQSMTVEASMLGTPSIRFNNFNGKISVIEELEKKYNLSYSLNTKESDKLILLINKLVIESSENYRERRIQMLKEKINVSAFYIWMISNYPNSINNLKINPTYQSTFK